MCFAWKCILSGTFLVDIIKLSHKSVLIAENMTSGNMSALQINSGSLFTVENLCRNQNRSLEGCQKIEIKTDNLKWSVCDYGSVE